MQEIEYGGYTLAVEIVNILPIVAPEMGGWTATLDLALKRGDEVLLDLSGHEMESWMARGASGYEGSIYKHIEGAAFGVDEGSAAEVAGYFDDTVNNYMATLSSNIVDSWMSAVDEHIEREASYGDAIREVLGEDKAA